LTKLSGYWKGNLSLLLAQPPQADAPLKFEVASIKPVDPGERIMPRAGGSEMRFVGSLRSLKRDNYGACE